jgi:hypothetical protein
MSTFSFEHSIHSKCFSDENSMNNQNSSEEMEIFEKMIQLEQNLNESVEWYAKTYPELELLLNQYQSLRNGIEEFFDNYSKV